MVSPKGIVLEYFSEKVPDDVTARLFKESKNPIHELEVLPVLMALQLWQCKLQKSQVVFYIDNESARMAYIRGCGETSAASIYISEFVSLEAENQLRSWFARVPSHSNPADGASRLDCSELINLRASQTTYKWESVRCLF